jgi:hypothetical protein
MLVVMLVHGIVPTNSCTGAQSKREFTLRFALPPE